MIVKTCEHCGLTHLEPDPPASVFTMDQRFEFERAWDARVLAAQQTT